jgi:hypothetical protein
MFLPFGHHQVVGLFNRTAGISWTKTGPHGEVWDVRAHQIQIIGQISKVPHIFIVSFLVD